MQSPSPDIKLALKSQYEAGLAMLRQAIERCPQDLWVAGEHPRKTWRIAYHAIYYTHLYLHQTSADFVPWEKHINRVSDLWGKPKGVAAFTKEEILDYLESVVNALPDLLDSLDLTVSESGFSYYPNMTKLEHQLVNVRHLQGHVGQLSELLMQRSVQTDWISSR